MDVSTPPEQPHKLRDFLQSLYFNTFQHLEPCRYSVLVTLKEDPSLVNQSWCDDFGIWTPLLYVCYQWLANLCDKREAARLVEVLLSQGADPNGTGLVLLDRKRSQCLATGTGYVALLDEPEEDLEVWYGDVSPLYIATRAKATLIIEILLVAGANVRQLTSNGQTILHGLCKSFIPNRTSAMDKTLVTMLLERVRLNVNDQDSHGRTALHYLVANYSHAHFEYLSMLLKKGASVDVQDSNGRNVLQLAAERGKLGLVEHLLSWKSWSPQEAAEAYELLGHHFRQRSCYELLMKATLIRLNGNCPKEMVAPLACYGSVQEWNTEKELSAMRNASDYLETQCQIARERIFKDRAMDLRLMNSHIYHCLHEENPRANLLIVRQIELFRRNGDYRAFCHVFVAYPESKVLPFLLKSQNPILPEYLALAVDCCQRLKESAKQSVKISDFRNLTYMLESTALVALFLTEVLESQIDVKPFLFELSKACDIEVPKFLYRRSLVLTFLRQFLFKLFPHELFRRPLQSVTELLQLILKYSDCKKTDEFNNSCLHLYISSLKGNLSGLSFPVISHMIEEGIHYDARNLAGQTAEDIVKETDEVVYRLMTQLRPFPSLKCLTANVIKSHIDGFEANLPRLLADFVAVH